MKAQTTERVGNQDEAAWETQLFARFLAGCQESFRELYDSHQPVMLRSLLRSFDEATAQDLTQEAWILAATKGHQFRAGSSFRSWIGTILRQQVALYFRKNRRYLAAVAIEESGVDPASEIVDPEQFALDAEGRELLRKAIDALKPDEARAFRSVHVDGLTIGEAASMAGVPHATFRKRLHRSLQRVKVLLALKVA